MLSFLCIIILWKRTVFLPCFSLYSLEFVQDHPLLVPIMKMYMYSKTMTVVILSSFFLFDWKKTRLTT